MDCEPGDGILSFSDLSNECQDIGAERMFIPWRGVPTQAPDTRTQAPNTPARAALADKGEDTEDEPTEPGEDPMRGLPDCEPDQEDR
jgi:hypothetical protein